MPNDAKLGFLAGVAGVVVAAVLFFQNQPEAVSPAPQTAGGPAAALVPPRPASTAAAPPRSPAPVPAAAPAAPGGTLTTGKRKEVEAQPVSRTTSDLDE